MKIIEATLIEISKIETVVKEEKNVTGKIIIDQERRTLTVIGYIFDLAQVQNNLYRIQADTKEYFDIPFAGGHIIPGTWTIIFKSEES